MNGDLIKLSKNKNLVEHLGESLLPSFFGYSELKESLLLQLFGGRYTTRPDRREDIHILLVGEDGLSMETVVNRIEEITSTNKLVGEDIFWKNLEKSINSIGIFHDLGGMHSRVQDILKIIMLTANISILATAILKKCHYDPYIPLTEQFKISEDILSHFDLILPLREIIDEERDGIIAKSIIKENTGAKDKKEFKPSISTEKIKRYISYAKENVTPILQEDSEASELITQFYCLLRSKHSIKVNPNFISNIIRLAEASAKMRLSNEVIAEDVERAKRIIIFSLQEMMSEEDFFNIEINKNLLEEQK